MMIRLSDTVFSETTHIKWGKPVEVPERIPEGMLPTDSIGLTPSPVEWNVTPGPRCSGLSRVSFSLNGMDREAWICQSYLDYKKLGSHGDAYAAIVNGAWKEMKDEPEIDLVWGRKAYRQNRIYEFEESVMYWGYGSEMTNTIPTARFIKLICIGRGRDDREWIDHATALLNAVQLDPTDNPVEKAANVFSNAKHVAELLKVIANEMSKSERTQVNNYRQWKQRTKSISTTY